MLTTRSTQFSSLSVIKGGVAVVLFTWKRKTYSELHLHCRQRHPWKKKKICSPPYHIGAAVSLFTLQHSSAFFATRTNFKFGLWKLRLLSLSQMRNWASFDYHTRTKRLYNSIGEDDDYHTLSPSASCFVKGNYLTSWARQKPCRMYRKINDKLKLS